MTDAPKPSPSAVTEEMIKRMANRFLGWKLPHDFHPDAGISFEPEFNKEWNARHGKPPSRREPSGTNLFDATQATEMVRYMVEGLPALSQPSPAGADYVLVRIEDIKRQIGRFNTLAIDHRLDCPRTGAQEMQAWLNSQGVGDYTAEEVEAVRAAIAKLDAAAPAQPAPTVRSAHHFSDKECPDCGATNIHVLGFSCQHEHCPVFAEEQKPCPVCGNEERGQGGYLSCECPAPIAAGEEE